MAIFDAKKAVAQKGAVTGSDGTSGWSSVKKALKRIVMPSLFMDRQRNSKMEQSALRANLKQEEAEINQRAMFADYMKWLRTTDAPPKWTNWEDEEHKLYKTADSKAFGVPQGLDDDISESSFKQNFDDEYPGRRSREYDLQLKDYFYARMSNEYAHHSAVRRKWFKEQKIKTMNSPALESMSDGVHTEHPLIRPRWGPGFL